MSTQKDSAYNSPTEFTITLASLASSSSGVGRQSTEVDNTTTRYNRIMISAKIRMGTNPTADKLVLIYLIRNNNAATAIRDDGAGASDAALTIVNAPLIGVLRNPDATTGNDLRGNFLVYDPGPKWAIAVVNSSGVALDADAGDHVMSYHGMTIDIA